MSNIWLEHNTCQAVGPSQDDIEIHLFGAMSQIHIDYNQMVGPPAQCIAVFDDSGTTATLLNSTFTGNVCQTPGAEAFRFVGLVNSTITGNRIMSSVGAAIHLAQAASVKCVGNLVSGNNIDYASGANGNAVLIDAGCTSNFVTTNIFGQTSQVAVSNLGGTTNKIRYNIGYVTENAGSVAFGASTSVSTNHGLVTTPTSVTATASATACGAVAVTGITTSQITFTYTSCAATIYWSAVYWP